MARFKLTLLLFLCFIMPAIPAIAGAADDPPGACCIPPSYQCFVTTQVQCDAWGGIWFGDGTVCDPNP